MGTPNTCKELFRSVTLTSTKTSKQTNKKQQQQQQQEQKHRRFYLAMAQNVCLALSLIVSLNRFFPLATVSKRPISPCPNILYTLDCLDAVSLASTPV